MQLGANNDLTLSLRRIIYQLNGLILYSRAYVLEHNWRRQGHR
jgi:hypothetical protein